MVLDLEIKKGVFKDDKGISHVYPYMTTQLEGQSFSLYLKDNDKKLFNYLLKLSGFFDKE